MNNKSRDPVVGFWGTPPPVIGGMTVHIERLASYLEREGITHEFYNFRSEPHPEKNVHNINSLFAWYLRMMFGTGPKVHYVITSNAFVRFMAVLLRLRGKVVILRVGGESLAKDLEAGGVKKLVNILAVKNANAFIAVNQEIFTIAQSLRGSKRITELIPGFIMPLDVGGGVAAEHIQAFLHSPALKMLFSGIVYPKEGRDIYGAWIFLDALYLLHQRGIDFRVVLFAYNQGDADGRNEFAQAIKELGLESKILLERSSSTLVPVFKYVDAFIRPAITDGDSNALREAVSFKIPSLASDVVKRPECCLLFKSESVEDLAERIAHLSENLEKEKKAIENSDIPNNGIRIVELIKQLISL